MSTSSPALLPGQGGDLLRRLDLVAGDVDGADQHLLLIQEPDQRQRHMGGRALQRDAADAAVVVRLLLHRAEPGLDEVGGDDGDGLDVVPPDFVPDVVPEPDDVVFDPEVDFDPDVVPDPDPVEVVDPPDTATAVAGTPVKPVYTGPFMRSPGS